MAQGSKNNQKTETVKPKAGNSRTTEVEVEALVAALRAAEEKNVELTDLITRLNRNLRQLEEQNRLIITQLQKETEAS